MNRKVKNAFFILVLVCTISVLSLDSLADVTALQERTIEKIRGKYYEKPFRIINAGWENVEYDVEPSSKFPYAAGRVKDKYLQEALNALNFVRYVAGLPDDVYIDETYTNYAQHGAVLLAALDTLTNSPQKPGDMPEKFYETAYKGPSSSNCSYGYNNILSTIFGYMDDSDSSNIDRVGHRRWLLNPPLQKTGFGYCERYSDTYVFDWSRKNTIKYDFIAWPAKNYMPVELMHRNIAWSVNLGDEYDYPSINDVKVILERKNDGKTWVFSRNGISGGDNGYFNVDNNNYGMPKCIIFRPDIDGYEANDIFDVTITGISKGGSPAEIRYTVQMFNLLQPAPVKADKKEGTYLNGMEVALFCETPDADIYYTTDGSIPTPKSNWYMGPIYIDKTTVIKAISYINGEQSEVYTFHYNIEQVSEWAVSDIEKAISLKLIPPSMQQSYRENISRADFCRLALNFLVQKTGKPIEKLLRENNVSIRYDVFTDTSDKEILAANALGIVKGIGGGRFNPNGLITRQEAAVMLMRTAAVLGITETNGKPQTFADSDEFAEWAKEAIAFVSSLRDKTADKAIMGGVGNGRFSPNGNYTREQSYVTMLRLFNAIE
ncbi:dockerin type 1 [Thermoclostridium stercorarium subsp. thermolacticum DSM 2910]|uniref:Dockerin type 1 n=1 Tax=Thermoclostridium stercorarium subsp. thermolacticum DSM 2910 TaxID=1121336 RepID=A0A1B1YCQ7_THEST|nr:chitobiase/beta-hexosaminidase C-terminal domain-containing protein [Thermoclostridium stercorarium]ANW98549.1 dockerin type 1 [Thermoclostridium stercorarium subsp. thermolacticum DSM 2910]